jgi:YD repeat-containing protein
VILKIATGLSRLVLPVRPPEKTDETPPMPIIRGAVEKQDVTDAKILATTISQTGPDASGFVSIRKEVPEPEHELTDIGTTLTGGSIWTRSIREKDPNSSVWSVEWTEQMRRGAWNTTTRSSVELTSTAEEFRMRESITAWEAERQVFTKAWNTRIKRDLL